MDLLSPNHLITTFGTIGVLLVVFAESGLLVGFFLPGDSLLITAGALASAGKLNLPVILVGVFVAAVAGDQVGYAIGHRAGPALFSRPDSRFFKKKHVERAEQYFAERGPRTVVMARFVPVVRTFVPIVAGMSDMPYRTFALYNVLGGLAWGVGVTMIGYALGEAFNIDKYLLPVVALIIVASSVPVVREIRRERKETRSESGSKPSPVPRSPQP